MTILKKEEFLRRLEDLDEETLSFLSEYAEERQKSASIQAIVTGVLGSIAGLAFVASHYFPQASEIMIGIAATVVGALVGAYGFFGKRQAEAELIRRALRQSALYGKEGAPLSTSKKRLIERYIKAEGL